MRIVVYSQTPGAVDDARMRRVLLEHGFFVETLDVRAEPASPTLEEIRDPANWIPVALTQKGLQLLIDVRAREPHAHYVNGVMVGHHRLKVMAATGMRLWATCGLTFAHQVTHWWTEGDITCRCPGQTRESLAVQESQDAPRVFRDGSWQHE